MALSKEDKIRAIELLKEKERRKKYRGAIYSYFPDEGKHRRELYQKHLEFFRMGKTYRERCFMAANRVGKTESGGGYETALHLTGLYPDWWEGRVFEKPVRALCAGDTGQTTRDIIQLTLFGTKDHKDHDAIGSGLLPRDCIHIPSLISKQGIGGAIDSIKIKHVSGGYSECALKSYDQGRRIFQGEEKEVVWFDEEPPIEVYNEALIRTMTTKGLTMLTFTPLSGMSETVISFLPKEYKAGDTV